MSHDLSRYHRQMLLPGFGEEGQRRLLASQALIVGCGALGTVAANLLARAGVGRLVIADRDVIELTNLQRQVLFDEDDWREGIPKAEAARRKIARINAQVKVTSIVDDVNRGNIERLMEGCDVVVDGLDNFETRFLLNDAAVKHGVPYVYGGAVGTVGMSLAVLPHTARGDRAWERAGVATPCLRCVFEQAPPPGMNPTCDTVGVLGPMVSMIASWQASEALKILTGHWGAVSPTMLNVDAWSGLVKQFKVGGAYELGDCVCCKQRRFEFLEGKLGSSATTLCGRDAVQLTHRTSGGRLDLQAVAGRLAGQGELMVNAYMLRAAIREGDRTYELTLFPDGRAIIKGTSDAGVARGVYARYVGG